MSADILQQDLLIKQWDLALKAIIGLLGFIGGTVFTRFSMSKKERKDFQAKLLETSNTLLAQWQNALDEYTAAIQDYVMNPNEADFDKFYQIAVTGDRYFCANKAICDAILSKNIDAKAIRNTHLPSIRDVVDRTLPNHYTTLQQIAKDKLFHYTGELKVENYNSIYEVYTKYKLGVQL